MFTLYRSESNPASLEFTHSHIFIYTNLDLIHSEDEIGENKADAKISVCEKGRDLTQSYGKAPTLPEKSNKQHDNIKHATKNLDYTTIADRLRTVSWSNSSHPTGVVKPVYELSIVPLTATAV